LLDYITGNIDYNYLPNRKSCKMLYEMDEFIIYGYDGGKSILNIAGYNSDYIYEEFFISCEDFYR